MRHPVRDRFVMLLFALVSFCAAGLLIAVTLGKVTAETVAPFTAQIAALPQRTATILAIAGAVVLILLGLALLNAMFPPKKKRSSSFAIQQNENGTVRISLKAIDALVNKCLSQHPEIKVVTSSLFSDEETVRVDVHIALLTDISMPLAISVLQKQITRYVEACSGVNVKEVRVFVDGTMPGGEKAQHSKYALPATVLCGETAEEPAEEAAEEENAAKETPAEEETSAQEEAPSVAETPVVQEETVVQEEPAVEEAPAVEEVPAAEEAPAVEEVPTAEETAAAEEALAAEEAPVAEEAPAAEEAMTAEETPAIEEIPAAEEAKTEKKKGFFGLFGRK